MNFEKPVSAAPDPKPGPSGVSTTDLREPEPTDVELRMFALQQAVKLSEKPGNPEVVLSAAKTLYAFLKGGE